MPEPINPATAMSVFLEGKKEQQHIIERIVKQHLGEATQLAPEYFKTELEKIMHNIELQVIAAIKREGEKLNGFESIYLKG